VLEIGTGSGYFTALLASRGAEVTSVEINPRLAAEARARLARPGMGAVEQRDGDAAQGFGTDAYDAIVLTGSTPILPDALVAQLKPGGRLFAVVGDAPVMTARLMRSVGPESVTTTDLFETVIDPLKNAAQPARFRF
jgi:protein-L-isoaspartate(D-aspartate) O-methyltransferase